MLRRVMVASLLKLCASVAWPSGCQAAGCTGGGSAGCTPPKAGGRWDTWSMASSTYQYCYPNDASCPMAWLFNNSKPLGELAGLPTFAGVTGVDHYYTKQGMPCVGGKPHEFAMQDALATHWKSAFPAMRFLSYRILSAVPYDMVVQDKIVSDPDFFVQWQKEPSASTKAQQKCPKDGCKANSICYNYISSCFNDPTRINNPAHKCSFPIRAAAYNFARPEVRDWFVKNIVAPTMKVADGAWLDGNGPDNGAFMCAGICCKFNASNSPHSQTQIDDFCAGEKATAIASHKYLIEHDGYEYNCMTFLSGGLPGAGQGAEKCSANLKALAAQKHNMTVVYGRRTGSSGYDSASMGGAVAAFLLARAKHWLFHMPKNLTASTAALVLSDYGKPLGNMSSVPGKPGFWRREYEKATVELDCATFQPTFTLKADDDAVPVTWKSAQELTMINAGPWPVSEPQAGGMLRRLPFAAKGIVRSTIYGSSEDTAGLAVRFRSDARTLLINASLTSSSEEMPHMPATGESGFDLYCWDDGSQTYRWVALWTPAGKKKPWSTAASGSLTGPAPLPALAAGATREYILYLPLYNGVKYVSIGVEGGASLLPSPSNSSPRPKPVVFYGTSITQGGVVSRPGMAFTNIIGRSLSRDVLNFGYSGQGLMEISVATFLVKVKDAGAFVIDCNPNMAHVDWCGLCGCTFDGCSPDCKCSKTGTPAAGGHGGAGPGGIRNRTVPLVQSMRSRGHPTTPIILAEGTQPGSAWADDYQGSYAAFNAALREEYLKLVKMGDKHIFYVFGKDLFANDTHSVDIDTPTAAGCHPTDVGHYRIARHYSTVLPGWMSGATNEANARAVQAEQNRYIKRSIVKDNNSAHRARASTLTWTKAEDLSIRGIPTFAPSLPMGSPFHRFPAAAQEDLTAEMWKMSTWGSGTFVRFDSAKVGYFTIKFTLTVPYEQYESLMPIDGSSGLDMYNFDTNRSMWLFTDNCLGAFEKSKGSLTLQCAMGGGVSGKHLLYLPLYNGIAQLSIGHSVPITPGIGTAIDKPQPAIIWFGTSITQGGAASRPGAQWLNGVSRSLGRPVVNWGFAGPGQMQISVAKYIVKLKPAPAAVVIDCLPDMDEALVTANTAPLIKYLRASGLSKTPILLVEGTNYTNQWLFPNGAASKGVPATWMQPAKRRALKREYDKLVDAGDKNLHYVEGSQILGQEAGDLESPLVGGVHPSDLGGERMRSFWVKQLPAILGSELTFRPTFALKADDDDAEPVADPGTDPGCSGWCPQSQPGHKPFLPKWKPTWDMKRSTQLMACNASGYHDVAEAIQYGVTVYDWGNAKAIWANTKPMDNNELLTKQAAMVLAADPGIKGEQPRVWQYRNTIKALNWIKQIRVKLDDPQYAGWFVRFKDYKGPSSNGSYNVPACTLGQGCSGFYHDQGQTPQHPTGDGSCRDQCDCGQNPCGEYIFDHRNSSFAAWFIDEWMISNQTILHPSGGVSLGFLDDWMGLNEPSEEDKNFVADTGLSKAEMPELVAAYKKTMNKMYVKLVAMGGWSYQLMNQYSGPHVLSRLNKTTAQCAGALREWCSDAPDSIALSAAHFYGVGEADALANGEDYTAEFLISRGPFAWIGYGCCSGDFSYSLCGKYDGWNRTNGKPLFRPRPAWWDKDYGKPLGVCTEGGVDEANVFTRQYEKATVQWDCAKHKGSIVMKADDDEDIMDPPEWTAWQAAHGRRYQTAEEATTRRLIYESELAKTRRHNLRYEQGLETFTVAVNGWSDLTHGEWAVQMGLRNGSMAGYNSSGDVKATWLPEDDVDRVAGGPTSLDWRTKGAVTKVKNQGGCGGCWSFGATGTMEGAWFLAKHKLESLSEGQLIDCSGQNCGGGNPGHAIDYVVHNRGIDSERNYRYTAKNGRCDSHLAGLHVAAMAASRNVPQRNERQLMAAVLKQPVAVAIDAVDGGFRGYHRGVLGGKCGTKIDHSVLVVGFGDEVLPAPPPPGPKTVCAVLPLPHSEICFNISALPRLPKSKAPCTILPKPAKCRGSGCFIWSYSSCSAACHELNESLAALSSDHRGNDHCSCGTTTDLSSPCARARSRPLTECTTPGNLTRNCSVSTAGCLCRNVGTEKARCARHCDEACGNETRALVFGFNCTVIAPKPAPPPPKRIVPYWIVKNSWGAGYGAHGYIKMQRGVGSAGLCCINCQPQYAVSVRGPAPAPPVPPIPPSPRCNVSAAARGCFNVSGAGGLLLPHIGGRDSDRATLQACASVCGWAWKWNGTWSAANFSWDGPGWQRSRSVWAVAGLQLESVADKKHKRSATDRCSCGVAANLSSAAAAARALPVAACNATACTGDKNESCGASGVMATFGFVC